MGNCCKNESSSAQGPLGWFDQMIQNNFAYAEAARFPEAVKTVQKAIELFQASGQINQAELAADLARLYQKNQPFREIR